MKKLKAAMVVIVKNKKDILILKRPPGEGWMPEKWGLPGGHIEENELPKDAAVREVKEETNLDLNNIFKLKQRGQVMIYYSTSYNGQVQIDFEHTDWAWAPYDELDDYNTTPDLKEAAKMTLEKLQ